MPRYDYKCSKCGQINTFFHSMGEKKETCEICNTSGCLTRVPSKFILFENKNNQKVGTVVKESIEEFREDLALEKEKLKNELFQPDE